MGEIKHTARFAEIERIFGDYFNSHLAPVMRDTQDYLNRKQVEEMAAYSTSAAGILGSMAAAANPMMDPYQTLKVTGEWNSKTTEDYIEMCKDKIANNKEIQADLTIMANEWRTAVVDEIGRERYDELSGQLGGDLAYAYTEYRIGELMMGKMVKDNMPKSSAEYIMRKAAQNTLFGLSYTLNQSPLAAEIERRGEAAYKPSKLEKGTGKVIGASIDAISLGGAGSWASFAKFVGVDLAFSALTSSKDKTGNTASVEDCISKGVFGSERNVFDRFRKDANEIRANDNPYIIATNERLTKKIPVQGFDFRDWMSHNAQAKMLFDFIAGKVLCALSGGVDSSVCAAMLAKAIGKQLTCVFVDHGLLRKNEREEVCAVFGEGGQFDINFICVDARERFYSKLAGVTAPEGKRKIIGEEFIRVFEEEAKKIGAVDYLAQGTIYPDVVESGLGGESATIKSHHNVGGLPDFVDFKEIVEPLRDLFKDEVRQSGRELGLPENLVARQPFPGPGLAIRIIGDVTPEKVAIVQDADAIYREEVDKLPMSERPSQYFAALTNMRSVGVMGDERTYDYAIALRAVTTTDFMTAEVTMLPPATITTAANRIVNEVKHINRVLFDYTTKPPATIEFE